MIHTKTSKQGVSDFLFAGKKLHAPATVNLLIASSFGLNAIFYAAWLGYAIGIWGLVIQLAWSISFFLLIPAAKHFRRVNSLHDLLGKQFGNKTKVLASICSLIGINYMVVWEVNIDKSTIAPLLHIPKHFFLSDQGVVTAILIGIFAVVTILYTLLFGLRGNAIVDKYFNILKIAILVCIFVVCLDRFLSLPSHLLYKSILPSFSTVIANVGVLGLITNIVFNLVWQFVDNSSWQSIIGGAKSSEVSTSRNLKYSGFLIFVVVNFLSTILGITLAQQANITSDNIIAMTAGVLPMFNMFISIGVIVLSIASMMSFVDGMLLTSALTVNIDILPRKILSKMTEQKRMKFIQLSVVLFGLLAFWIIDTILQVLQINLFNFVYIVILSQLALIGPVIFAIYAKNKKQDWMWVAILCALIVGFGSTILGGIIHHQELIDGAGTFAVIVSVLLAWIVKIFS